MGVTFSGSDVLELGIQIEKNGRDFYAALAEKSKNEKAKEIFEYLGKQEAQHIEDFTKLLDNVGKENALESYQGEYDCYLKSLASEHVFTKKNMGEKIARALKSDKEGIETALGFEKDSILLFGGMKDVVGKKSHSIIDELIRQEQAHFTQLVELRRKLNL